MKTLTLEMSLEVEDNANGDTVAEALEDMLRDIEDGRNAVGIEHLHFIRPVDRSRTTSDLRSAMITDIMITDLAERLAQEILAEEPEDPTRATADRLATVFIRLGKLTHDGVKS